MDWRTDVNVNPSPSEAPDAVMAPVRGALVTRTIAIPAGQASALADCHSREPPPRGRDETPLRGRTLRLVGVPLSVRRVSHQRRQAPSSYIWLATERRAERTTEPSPPTALRSPLRLCVEPERARGNEWVGVRASTHGRGHGHPHPGDGRAAEHCDLRSQLLFQLNSVSSSIC